MSLARLIECENGCALLWLSLHGCCAAVLPHGSARVLACLDVRCCGCHCMDGVLPCCRTEQRECVSIDGTHFIFGAWERQAIPQSASPTAPFAQGSLCCSPCVAERHHGAT